MKKILILAYDFPPYVSVGGLRPHGWYNYLKNFDIEPVVITRQWESKHGNYLDYISRGSSNQPIIENSDFGTIVYTPYKPNLANRILLKYGENKFKIIRKSISLFYEISQYFFTSGPKKEIYKHSNQYIRKNKVDFIIATGDPFVLFHYASKLSAKYNIPWIADYRDPWSFGMGMENLVYRNFNRFFEKRTLRNVEFITTVHNSLLNNLKKITSKKIFVLPNGYDPNSINQIQPKSNQNKALTISYIGTILNWHPIELFLQTLVRFIDQNGLESIILNFYGINNPEHIQTLIDIKYTNLKEVVHIFPKLPNKQVLTMASESDLLMLFNNYAVIGTKIYDYIGLKTPILFCFSNDPAAMQLRDEHDAMADYQDMDFEVQEKVIKNKDAGFIIKDKVHLLEVLNICLKEFEQTGMIKSKTKDSEEFSRKHQTGRLAELINKLTN